MKLIDQYISAKKEYETKAAEGKLGVQEMVELQELNYRIDVLDTVRKLCATAPLCKEGKVLCHHYALASAYLRFLPKERQFGNKADNETKSKRETANEGLQRVIDDGCKRFQSFKADTNESYKKLLNAFAGNVLTIWVQYRNTYVKIGG